MSVYLVIGLFLSTAIYWITTGNFVGSVMGTLIIILFIAGGNKLGKNSGS